MFVYSNNSSALIQLPTSYLWLDLCQKLLFFSIWAKNDQIMSAAPVVYNILIRVKKSNSYSIFIYVHTYIFVTNTLINYHYCSFIRPFLVGYSRISNYLPVGSWGFGLCPVIWLKVTHVKKYHGYCLCIHVHI